MVYWPSEVVVLSTTMNQFIDLLAGRSLVTTGPDQVGRISGGQCNRISSVTSIKVHAGARGDVVVANSCYLLGTARQVGR